MNINYLLEAILHKMHYEELPDALFLKFKYFVKTGRFLNLRKPKTFTEKLQWLKLYNRKPEYTSMVDKIAVKEYVASRIGKEYIIPTICVWPSVKDVDFKQLPEKFVLKTNNGGGSNGVVICRDKRNLNIEDTVKQLEKSLKSDIYKNYREWPYKNVLPRIFAEHLLEMPDELDLPDYKFFCFNGKPHYCQVISNRRYRMSIDFFDKDWNHQTFREPKEYPFATTCPRKPKHYDEMWHLAETLACGTPFVRIDFYDTGDKVYFGEITFFPTSGMQIFEPRRWDRVFGELISLPSYK